MTTSIKRTAPAKKDVKMVSVKTVVSKSTTGKITKPSSKTFKFAKDAPRMHVDRSSLPKSRNFDFASKDNPGGVIPRYKSSDDAVHAMISAGLIKSVIAPSKRSVKPVRASAKK